MACLLLIIAGRPLLIYGVTDFTVLFAFGLLSKYSIFPFLIKILTGEGIAFAGLERVRADGHDNLTLMHKLLDVILD